MKILLRGLIIFSATCFAFGLATPMPSAQDSYDIVIEGGKIVDGTGNPWYYGDAGILNGRIVKIGELKKAGARKRLDAANLVVVPGFVDIHTQTDTDIEKLPLAQNYIQQGVTTIVGGNGGDSIYPIGEKLAALERLGLGINFALLAGQTTVRRQVIGIVDRFPTAGELKMMKGLVAKAIKEGALGISTGLYYAPGSYSKTDEVIELAKVAA